MQFYINTRQQAEKFFQRFSTFLLDCDGVIYRGKSVLPYVNETLEFLRSKGKKVFFVTNNATKSRKEYLKKFKELGIHAEEKELYTSSYASALYLRQQNFKGKVYVIGERGITEELENVGIEALGGERDADKRTNVMESFSGDMVDTEVKAVVAGYDGYFNNYKLAYAHHCIRNHEGCLFLATNMDATFPTAKAVLPGGGSFVSALSWCAGIEPLVLGKPEKLLLETIMADNHLEKSEICMVGDRKDTDILFGINGNVATLLVFTGVTKESEVSGLVKTDEELPEPDVGRHFPEGTKVKSDEISPDYVCEGFGRIYELLQEGN